MARIAEGTCATCHTIRPKNEMREVAVSRRVGSRYGVSHSKRGNRESASVQYRRQFVWVCRGCPAPKSDGLIPWKLLIAIVAGLALYAWMTNTQPDLVRRVTGASAPSRHALAAAENDGSPMTPGDDKDQSAATSTESPAKTDGGMLAGIGSAIGDAVAPSKAFDWNQDAITTATLAALDNGKAQKWKVDGGKGQAVPSTVTTNPDGSECRNVYQTAKVDHKTQTSAVVAWCRTSADGPWNSSSMRPSQPQSGK